MSQTQTDEKEEEKEELQIIEQSTTSQATYNPPKITKLKTSISNSTSTLLSANYNPSHNPKKDELVQNASIKILEVESLLDKLNNHIDKHHRKSSKKLQDFEQIHSELAKIQSNLIYDDNDNNNHKNKRSKIDPFIIIASNDNDNDDDDDNEEEKDDEKTCNNSNIKTETVHNDKLAQLEPFQSLVSKIQKEIDPNLSSSDDSEIDNNSNPTSPQSTKTPKISKKSKHNRSRNSKHSRSRNSIKMKKSELHSISDYVQEHRNKMKEKTYQYEQKKEQLKHAKERLNKAKARFKKRLNKSKQRNRNRAYSDNKRKGLNIHAMTTSDISTRRLSPRNKFHTINENSDVDIDNQTVSLSQANLSKFNHNGSISSDNTSPSQKEKQSSAPIINIHLGQPSTPNNTSSSYNGALYGHNKSPTNGSVQSVFSAISDQSFVDDFHSITAELENIDDIVRNQVKSPSMTSIFSDLGSPLAEDNKTNNNKKTQFTFNSKEGNDSEDHIKNNISSMSESESKDNKNMPSYCSSIETSEANSLQSELFQLQDIENQINDL